MTRNDILEKFENLSVNESDALADVIDHMELKFNEIFNLLNSLDSSTLCNINEAMDIADELATKLY